MERESMEFDVVIVGGGVSGLASAIRLRQLCEEHGHELSVCVLEKGSEIGAHILSGAVVDPIALAELIPDWRDKDCPMTVEVTENHHWFLHDGGHREMPHFALPPMMNNKGCYTVSLGNLTRWLGEQAEALGIEVYPGFAAAEVLYHEDGSVKGVATGDMGIAKDGTKKDSYEPGIELHAKYTFFAEGVRGNLSKEVIAKYDLRAGKEPQTYAIGIKELWDIPPENHKPGR
ncbi:MAG: NAD(P)/FAD-dependent oxidoreductase, partial [Pseudomonadota bacterium]